jgi:L-rhamnose mutarotase
MTNRRYLERLKNIQQIMDTANQILDLELEIDKLEAQKQKIIHDLSKNRLIIDEIRNNDSTSSKSLKSIIQTEVDHPSTLVIELEEVISKKEKEFFILHQIMKDEVRSGLTEMFHEAMKEHDKIEKNLFKLKKMTIGTQKAFQESNTPESHQEWIEYCNKLMAEEEKLRENEREIDNIKCVFQIECEEK